MNILPPINSTGIFGFKKPYKDYIDSELILKVTAIRSIKEIIASGEEPFEFIYKNVGRTEAEMNLDVTHNAPIVVFTTTGDKFIYVPGNMIESIPKNNGIVYQDKVIGLNLGSLRKDTDLTNLLEQLEDIVYSTLGVKTKPEILNTSAEVLIDYTQDAEYQKLLDSRKKFIKPYSVIISELEEELAKTNDIKIKLENFIKDKFFTKDDKIDSELTVAELVDGSTTDTPPEDPVTVHELIYSKPTEEEDPHLVTAEELANSNVNVK